MTNWVLTNLIIIRHQKILNLMLKKKNILKIFWKSDNCLILRLSIAAQLSIHLPFAWIQFSFIKEQMIFRYESIKSVKIKINRWTKRACHRFLPIDRYNRYQWNQIYRFLSIFRLINRYRFLSIDYSWALNYFSSVNNAGVLHGRLPPDFVFVSLYIVFNSINPLSLQKRPFSNCATCVSRVRW